MMDSLLALLYAMIAATGLAADPQITDAPAPTPTEGRPHTNGVEGDIYNGF